LVFGTTLSKASEGRVFAPDMRLPTIATAATVYAKQEPQPKCCATVTNLFTYGF
jgi:hypothetical protein